MMNSFVRLPVAAIGLSLVLVQTAAAQLSVQVPYVRSIGGRFSTVVPDRGSVSLGGISRSGRSYSRGGCGCFGGPGAGTFLESSNLSVSAWIHDLREMDRMVLDAADSPAAEARLRASGLIADSAAAVQVRKPAFRDEVFSRRERQAYLSGSSVLSDESRRLVRRWPSARDASSARSATISDDELPRIVVVNRSAALQWYRLGKAAEDSGKRDVAKLHYRQAARYGSALARNRLKELSE